MKTCFKCGVAKERSEFYAHKMMSDGLLGKCKECTKRDVKKNYDDNPERISEYERNRFKTKHRKEKFQVSSREISRSEVQLGISGAFLFDEAIGDQGNGGSVMRKMGIRAAWLYLAKKWDKPTKDTDGDSCVVIGKENSCGLCHSISDMSRAGIIDPGLVTLMLDAIRELMGDSGGWRWRTTRAGARQRAAFCRKMAAKYAKKAKVAK